MFMLGCEVKVENPLTALPDTGYVRPDAGWVPDSGAPEVTPQLMVVSPMDGAQADRVVSFEATVAQSNMPVQRFTVGQVDVPAINAYSLLYAEYFDPGVHTVPIVAHLVDGTVLATTVKIDVQPSSGVSTSVFPSVVAVGDEVVVSCFSDDQIVEYEPNGVSTQVLLTPGGVLGPTMSPRLYRAVAPGVVQVQCRHGDDLSPTSATLIVGAGPSQRVRAIGPTGIQTAGASVPFACEEQSHTGIWAPGTGAPELYVSPQGGIGTNPDGSLVFTRSGVYNVYCGAPAQQSSIPTAVQVEPGPAVRSVVSVHAVSELVAGGVVGVSFETSDAWGNRIGTYTDVRLEHRSASSWYELPVPIGPDPGAAAYRLDTAEQSGLGLPSGRRWYRFQTPGSYRFVPLGPDEPAPCCPHEFEIGPEYDGLVECVQPLNASRVIAGPGAAVPFHVRLLHDGIDPDSVVVRWNQHDTGLESVLSSPEPGQFVVSPLPENPSVLSVWGIAPARLGANTVEIDYEHPDADWEGSGEAPSMTSRALCTFVAGPAFAEMNVLEPEVSAVQIDPDGLLHSASDVDSVSEVLQFVWRIALEEQIEESLRGVDGSTAEYVRFENLRNVSITPWDNYLWLELDVEEVIVQIRTGKRNLQVWRITLSDVLAEARIELSNGGPRLRGEVEDITITWGDVEMKPLNAGTAMFGFVSDVVFGLFTNFAQEGFIKDAVRTSLRRAIRDVNDVIADFLNELDIYEAEAFELDPVASWLGVPLVAPTSPLTLQAQVAFDEVEVSEGSGIALQAGVVLEVIEPAIGPTADHIEGGLVIDAAPAGLGDGAGPFGAAVHVTALNQALHSMWRAGFFAGFEMNGRDFLLHALEIDHSLYPDLLLEEPLPPAEVRPLLGGCLHLSDPPEDASMGTELTQIPSYWLQLAFERCLRVSVQLEAPPVIEGVAPHPDIDGALMLYVSVPSVVLQFREEQVILSDRDAIVNPLPPLDFGVRFGMFGRVGMQMSTRDDGRGTDVSFSSFEMLAAPGSPGLEFAIGSTRWTRFQRFLDALAMAPAIDTTTLWRAGILSMVQPALHAALTNARTSLFVGPIALADVVDDAPALNGYHLVIEDADFEPTVSGRQLGVQHRLVLREVTP